MTSIREMTRLPWVVVALALATTACGGQVDTPAETAGQEDTPPETAELSVLVTEADFTEMPEFNWNMSTGLGPGDGQELRMELWVERISRACSAPIWEAEQAALLAREFVEEDEGDPNDESKVGAAADSLWLIAVNACRDSFPPEAIEAGPPSRRIQELDG